MMLAGGWWAFSCLVVAAIAVLHREILKQRIGAFTELGAVDWRIEARQQQREVVRVRGDVVRVVGVERATAAAAAAAVVGGRRDGGRRVGGCAGVEIIREAARFIGAAGVGFGRGRRQSVLRRY